MLDDRRAAVHPVAAIQVDDAVELLDHRGVDVPTDDAVYRKRLPVAGEGYLEARDEARRSLDIALGVVGERPVAGHLELAPRPGERPVQIDEQVVRGVAEHREPARAGGNLIELIAVQERVAFSVPGAVHIVFFQPDVAERGVEILLQSLVVVSGNVDDVDAVAGEPQQLLHHGVVALRPVHGPLERPEVDDVSEQEYRPALVLLEEREQAPRLARARAEMDVGKKQRADPVHFTPCTRCRLLPLVAGRKARSTVFPKYDAGGTGKKTPVGGRALREE